MQYSLLGKPCPTTYPMPFNPNWSNLGEDEDWNGERQKDKELKNNNIIEPQSPQYQSMFTTIIAQKLSNTLVPTTEERQKEEDDTENNSENDSETDYDSDDTLDNIV